MTRVNCLRRRKKKPRKTTTSDSPAGAHTVRRPSPTGIPMTHPTDDEPPPLAAEDRFTKRVWILYVNDGDAECGNPDDSSVLEAEGSGIVHDLRKMLDFWKGHDAVLYQYKECGKELHDEQMIGLLREGVDELVGRCS